MFELKPFDSYLFSEKTKGKQNQASYSPKIQEKEEDVREELQVP